MKVVQVNVIYGHGSTGRIVETLHKQYLKLGHDSYVLYGRGPKPEDKRVKRTGFLWEAKLWRFIQLFSGNSLGGSPLSTWRLKRNIKKLNPDVVHLHCINGNMCNVYSLLKWLKKGGYKTVLTHHGSFMYTGGCGLCLCDGNKGRCFSCPHREAFLSTSSFKKTAKNYQRMAKIGLGEPWIQHAFVSRWSLEQAQLSDFMSRENSTVVFNSVDTEVFKPEGERFDPGKPYVFFPFSEQSVGVKGGQYVTEIALKLKGLGYLLVTTGGDGDNVIGKGHISDPVEMASLYRGAEATILLSHVESFSMPVVESILCGTPVVGFECGGPSTLKTGGMAEFVPYGDLGALIDTLGRVKKETKDDLTGIYSPVTIAKEYLSLYEK